MLVSQNEISLMTEKAMRGLAVPWGYAKDCRDMACWLSGTDLPFLVPLLDCCSMLDSNPAISRINPFTDGRLHAPVHGLAMVEYTNATGLPWQGHVEAPIFLTAAMAILSTTLGISMMMENADSHRVIASDGGLSFSAGEHDNASDLGDGSGFDSSNIDPSDSIKFYPNQVLQLIPAGQSGITVPPLFRPRSGGVKVDENAWRVLSHYAHRSYVPETEQSRASGAGAGDIDNT